MKISPRIAAKTLEYRTNVLEGEIVGEAEGEQELKGSKNYRAKIGGSSGF